MRWMASLGLVLIAALANAQTSVVSAQARTVKTHLTAYARVEPIAILAVHAAEAGVVTGLGVRCWTNLNPPRTLASAWWWM